MSFFSHDHNIVHIKLICKNYLLYNNFLFTLKCLMHYLSRIQITMSLHYIIYYCYSTYLLIQLFMVSLFFRFTEFLSLFTRSSQCTAKVHYFLITFLGAECKSLSPGSIIDPIICPLGWIEVYSH